MRTALLAAGVVLLSLCTVPSPPPVAGPSPTPATSPTPRTSACASAEPGPTASGVTTSSPLVVLATGLNQPDDILVDGDRILVGEHGDGHIASIDGPGGLSRLPVVIPGVEGLARIGTVLFAADQVNNRIVTVNGTSVTPFLALTSLAGGTGVDGIAATRDHLLVPDSEQGKLLVVGSDGTVVRTIGGFNRPTGAWAAADGSLLVADEKASAIYRVDAVGNVSPLVRGLPTADDVAADPGGRILAVSVGDKTLVEVKNGSAPVLAAGFLEPQGLAVDQAGNAIVADLGSGTVMAVVLSFKLPRNSAYPPLAPGQPICLDIARAPGYADAIRIVARPGYTVISQPGIGNTAEVVPVTCDQPQCLLGVTATSGGRTDTVWIPYSTAARATPTP